MRRGTSFSVSVRGSSHEASGIERQDSAGTLYLEDVDCHVIVVADGHGDSSCPRSATGSAIAVEVAIECLSAFAREAIAAHVPAAGFDLSALTGSIVAEWAHRVAEHYDADPLPRLEEVIASDEKLSATDTRAHLYGTTLVAALLMPEACVLVQQGDGCCAAILSDGTIAENDQLIPEDELCVGNVTTSLSDAKAAEEIRSSCIDYADDRVVVACYVGTDGVDKSLPADGGFSEYVNGLTLDRVRERREERWEPELAQSVERLSRAGSRDDASLAGYVDLRRAKRLVRGLRREHELSLKMAELDELRSRRNSMLRKRAYYLSAEGRAKVDGHERTRYLSEFDELSLMVSDLEQELGLEPEPLPDVVLQAQPATAMPSAEAAPSGDVPGVGEQPNPTLPLDGEQATTRLDSLAGEEGARTSPAKTIPLRTSDPFADRATAVRVPVEAPHAADPDDSLANERARARDTRTTIIIVAVAIAVAIGLIVALVLTRPQSASSVSIPSEVAQDEVEEEREQEQVVEHPHHEVPQQGITVHEPSPDEPSEDDTSGTVADPTQPDTYDEAAPSPDPGPDGFADQGYDSEQGDGYDDGYGYDDEPERDSAGFADESGRARKVAQLSSQGDAE